MAYDLDGNTIRCKLDDNTAVDFVGGLWPLCKEHSDSWHDYAAALPDDGRTGLSVFFEWLSAQFDAIQVVK